ncbi:MAG: hypothetical protein ACRBDI_04825 [Alphaproteobacteria bacterium]
MRDNQSGNVLFYIFIAVGLLAALSYVVAQSGRGGVGNISAERAAIYASEIIEYGNIVSQATDQLRLRGYSDTQISFENSVVAGYVNANCTEVGCELFDVAGGAVNYMTPKAEWLDSDQSAQLRYGEIYFHGETSAIDVGTSGDDLIMFVPYLKKEVCEAVNSRLGIDPVNRDVPLEVNGPFVGNVLFTGAYGSVLDRKVSGDATTGETDILYGKYAGCTESPGGGSLPPAGTYHYFQVLLAR